MSILTLVIWIVVLGLIAWALTYVPLPAPFGKIIQVILIIAAVALIIFFLLGLADGGSVRVR